MAFTVGSVAALKGVPSCLATPRSGAQVWGGSLPAGGLARCAVARSPSTIAEHPPHPTSSEPAAAGGLGIEGPASGEPAVHARPLRHSTMRTSTPLRLMIQAGPPSQRVQVIGRTVPLGHRPSVVAEPWDLTSRTFLVSRILEALPEYLSGGPLATATALQAW